ncbi:hypothetical protein B4923_17975 [Brenneria roseae subsp. americana]|uniref:Uncharacterized protein n=1 Tax=Brenneria roseae subsp. americana TaxID=1508507 RepID=A0A2U1TL17_9GAMM|nr:hypothetical protein [Brenneria roseae]PWC10022.1 hypothetical protein B4923_17975 [Brenneria roseae subsp. americana]
MYTNMMKMRQLAARERMVAARRVGQPHPNHIRRLSEELITGPASTGIEPGMYALLAADQEVCHV